MNKPVKMLEGLPYYPSYDFPDPSIEDIAQELVNIFYSHHDLERDRHSPQCRRNCALEHIYKSYYQYYEND